MSDVCTCQEAIVTHPVYPGGPPCQPACPGPSSMYHDGYADGYEAGERLAPPPDAPLPATLPVPDGSGDVDRPARDPAEVAREHAWLEGYTAGKRDYSPGGFYATTPAPPPDALRAAVEAALDDAERHQPRSLPVKWVRVDAIRDALAAPQAEPSPEPEPAPFAHSYSHPGPQDCRTYAECHARAYGLTS